MWVEVAGERGCLVFVKLVATNSSGNELWSRERIEYEGAQNTGLTKRENRSLSSIHHRLYVERMALYGVSVLHLISQP